MYCALCFLPSNALLDLYFAEITVAQDGDGHDRCDTHHSKGVRSEVFLIHDRDDSEENSRSERNRGTPRRHADSKGWSRAEHDRYERGSSAGRYDRDSNSRRYDRDSSSRRYNRDNSGEYESKRSRYEGYRLTPGKSIHVILNLPPTIQKK